MFQRIFAQAWLLSVYREYNKPDGKIYDLYNSAMCIVCSFLIILDIPLAKFLYAKDFFETIITLYKKSNVVAITAVLGAIINLLLNYILINRYGTMGAAVATVVGYAVMCFFWVLFVYKIYPLSIN